MSIILALLVAYFLGAIPFSLLIGKYVYGVDLRNRGSQNLGATNSFYVLGPLAGLSVLVLDVGKGALALVIATHLGITSATVLLLVLAAGVIGHSHSPYIHFEGGKGVAVSIGGLLVLMPWVAIALFVTWIFVILLTRYVAVASIIIAAIFPFVVMASFPQNLTIWCAAVAVSVFVILKHKINVLRIIDGIEVKVRWGQLRESV